MTGRKKICRANYLAVITTNFMETGKGTLQTPYYRLEELANVTQSATTNNNQGYITIYTSNY